ncbi:MAG: nucleotidyl transferase AbiEii/AbiGii toxin family protein, partial [Acidimicrobiales bacterium]
MTKPYSTPPSNLRSLQDRLVRVAGQKGVLFGRLQRHVAVLVVAQLAATLADEDGAPLLLVKGGSSLELRRGISGSRTSKDLDTVARQDIESVYEQLADSGEIGWEGFTAIFTPPEEIDVPGLPIKPRRFVAKLSYRSKPFASVPIEVSTVEAGNADQFDTLTSEALGLVGVSADVTVPCMTLPWQIAQKLHAATAVIAAPKVNDRAHDLVDLQLLEVLLGEVDLAKTRFACLAVFAARAQHLWPPTVAALPHWPAIYSRALEGLGHLELAETVEAAAERVQR